MNAEQTDRRDIGRAALAMFAGFLPRMLAGLSFLFLAGNLYGAERLGAFFLATATVEIAGAFCVMGMKRSLFPILEHSEKTEPGQTTITQITFAALLIGLGLAIPISGVSFLWLHTITPASPSNLLSFALPLIVISDILLAIIRHKRVMVYQILSRSIVEPWTKALLCALFALIGMLEFGLGFAYLGGLSMAAIIAIYGYAKLYGAGHPDKRVPSRALIIRLIQNTFPTMITDLLHMLSRRIDLLLLGAFLGPVVAGPYGAAKEITTNVQKTQELFSPALAPIAAQTVSRRGGQAAGRQLAQVNRWIFTLQSIQWLFFYVAGAIILGWIGSGFDALYNALLLLLLAEIMAASSLSADLPVIFSKPWITTAVTAIGIALQTLFGVLLIPQGGALGAAYAIFVAAFLLSAIRLYTSWKVTGALCISFSFLKPLLAAAASFAFLTVIIDQLIMLDKILIISLAVPLALLPMALLLFCLGITKEDRGLLRDLFTKSS